MKWFRQSRREAGPVCQCGDGWCYHNSSGCWVVACACKRYCGPEPVGTAIEADLDLLEWARRKVQGT